MGWFGLSEKEKQYWNKCKEGDRADIIIEMDIREIYASRVRGISEDRMCLQIPFLGSSALEIQPNTMIGVRIYTDSGIFNFKAKMISQDWGKEQCIHVSKPKAIAHTQRRQYFRLNALLPVQYGAVQNYDNKIQSPVMINALGMTKNISEGGAMIVLDKILPVNSFIQMQIDLSADEQIVAAGRVLEQIGLEVSGKYVTRVQFVRIGENDVELIRRYIITHSFKNK